MLKIVKRLRVTGVGVLSAALLLNAGCRDSATKTGGTPESTSTVSETTNTSPDATQGPPQADDGGKTVVLGRSATGVPKVKNPPTAPSVGDVHTVEGAVTSLERQRGKVVILDFWATWCGPCRMTIPTLIELDKKYSKDGLVILGISDEKPETVKPFAEQAGMKYTVIADPAASVTWHLNYQVEGIPLLAVVDRKGKLRLLERGLDQTPGAGTHDRLNEIIPQLIAEK